MRYKYKILLLIAPAVFLLDQWTKHLIMQRLSIGESITVVTGYFDLVHYRNAGAAFGMLSNLGDGIREPFFYGISGIALLILIYAFLHLEEDNYFYPIPLSLIAGGVLGNFVDRVRFGNVVDFISLHIHDKMIGNISLEWPAFNVADSAITISMILLFAHTFRKK